MPLDEQKGIVSRVKQLISKAEEAKRFQGETKNFSLSFLIGRLKKSFNERKSYILYPEMNNSVYQALENTLCLEFEWAYADKNLYSTSWIALHLKDLGSEDFKKIETSLEMDLKKFRETKLSIFLTTEFILDICFATGVIYDMKRKISTGYLEV